MPMRMTADHTAPGPPYPVSLRVDCDGDHGMFDAPTAHFDVTGTPDPRQPAIAAGWRFDPNGPVYCPRCAGKGM